MSDDIVKKLLYVSDTKVDDTPTREEFKLIYTKICKRSGYH